MSPIRAADPLFPRAKGGQLAPRPPKRIEYEIQYATANAAKGWRDLAATILNSLAEAWDSLTRTPFAKTEKSKNVRTNWTKTTHPFFLQTLCHTMELDER